MKLELWEKEIEKLKAIAENGHCETCFAVDEDFCYCPLNVFNNEKNSCKENAILFLQLLEKQKE